LQRFRFYVASAHCGAQLNVGDGAVIITEQRMPDGKGSHSVMIRVEDVDLHYNLAIQSRARCCRHLPTIRTVKGNTTLKISPGIVGLSRSPLPM
jgi:hypothetical protein